LKSSRSYSAAKPAGAGIESGSCSRCGKPAVAYLAYSGCYLCAGHFTESVERRFKRTVRTHGLLEKNDHIAVALSGGKDSVVMLRLFKMLSKSLPLKLTAITIDEGIKGYRPNTLKVAAREAKRLGVKLIIHSFEKEYGFSLDRAVSISQKSGLPCSFCGVFRRHLLNRAAKKAGARKIAIGHNLDDIAQTFLMNVFRNDTEHISRMLGPQGLEGEGFVPRIRPLMEIPEKEIALYSVLKGMPIHFQQCPYATTALRQKVRDMLNSFEDSQPGTKIKAFKSALAISSAMLPNPATALRFCRECGEPASGELCMACRMAAALRERAGFASRGKNRKAGQGRHARGSIRLSRE